MLRFLALSLLLANLVFWAWTQGALDHLMGFRSTGDREPERLTQQVHPEALTVLSPASASAIAHVVAKPECLEAGPYTSAQLPSVEAAASAAFPGLTWVRRQVDQPGIWAVVMGPYPNRELLEKKQEELKRARVTFEELKSPPNFNWALSLGRHGSADAAASALAQLSTHGIKTARVAVLSPGSTQVFLHTETADTALLSQLRQLKGDPWGGGLTSCGP